MLCPMTGHHLGCFTSICTCMIPTQCSKFSSKLNSSILLCLKHYRVGILVYLGSYDKNAINRMV